MGAGSLGVPVLDAKGVYVVPLPIYDPIPVRTITEESGTDLRALMMILML